MLCVCVCVCQEKSSDHALLPCGHLCLEKLFRDARFACNKSIASKGSLFKTSIAFASNHSLLVKRRMART